MNAAAQPLTYTRRGEFLAGVRATIPLILGAIPFGIIFGALGVGSGLSAAATIGMSLFVFAGSAQFIAVGLAAQGSAVAFIVLTTFVVNLRHALYSASLAPYMKHLPQRWLLPLGFWLTDETYAVVITRYAQDDASPYKQWFHLGSSVFMYVGWQIWTLIGIVAGQQPGLAQLGLDFAMSVTFIGIVVPLLINRPMVVCALVAGATALLTYSMPNKMGLIVAAVAGIAAGIAMEVAMTPRRAQPPGISGEREVSP
ncbi:MAG: AzlC family ABC transporter permease [Anaerolineae bacterium]|nr:AzlC family ABC transporter permease [Anaerolineae bacterium]